MPYTLPELTALLRRMDAMEADGKEMYVFPIRRARQMVTGYITALEKLQKVPQERDKDAWDFTLPQ